MSPDDTVILLSYDIVFHISDFYIYDTIHILPYINFCLAMLHFHYLSRLSLF